ncbi:hypothetical protein [Propionivibrio sp.]|uniref:hypothetical protein n=1 Tax=Propionivibrio sp. TaxID=2212460 RepID=UPI0039E50BE2
MDRAAGPGGVDQRRDVQIAVLDRRQDVVAVRAEEPQQVVEQVEQQGPRQFRIEQSEGADQRRVDHRRRGLAGEPQRLAHAEKAGHRQEGRRQGAQHGRQGRIGVAAEHAAPRPRAIEQLHEDAGGQDRHDQRGEHGARAVRPDAAGPVERGDRHHEGEQGDAGGNQRRHVVEGVRLAAGGQRIADGERQAQRDHSENGLAGLQEHALEARRRGPRQGDVAERQGQCPEHDQGQQQQKSPPDSHELPGFGQTADQPCLGRRQTLLLS